MKIILMVINTRHIWLIGIMIICITQGCNKDWLDIKSDKSQAVPTTINDLQAILDDVDKMNGYSLFSLHLNEVAADGHYYTDQVYVGMAPNNFQYQNAYSWTTIEPFENIATNYYDLYMRPYQMIANCNVILDAKQGENDLNEFKHIRAQSLFHRASIYYNLAQTFARPYNAITADRELGLPLRLNTDITETSVRSTLKQTYDQITQDLKVSAENLPKAPMFITRASKPAAYGLLARVYLAMGDYDNSFHYANEYLNMKNELLNYNTLSISAATIGLNTEISFFQYSTAGQLNTTYLVDQTLYDSYDNNDLRKKLFFNVTSSGIRFKGKYSSNASHTFLGITTDEIYLTRAECYARKGELSRAMKDLNDLLRTRWAKNPNGSTTYIDQTANDEADALRKILNERKKQLILRGVRWTDLRRLNLDPRFATTLSRTIGGKEYTLEPNSPRYTFPFPVEAIQRSGMEQNPGW